MPQRRPLAAPQEHAVDKKIAGLTGLMLYLPIFLPSFLAFFSLLTFLSCLLFFSVVCVSIIIYLPLGHLKTKLRRMTRPSRMEVESWKTKPCCETTLQGPSPPFCLAPFYAKLCDLFFFSESIIFTSRLLAATCIYPLGSFSSKLVLICTLLTYMKLSLMAAQPDSCSRLRSCLERCCKVFQSDSGVEVLSSHLRHWEMLATKEVA